MRSVLVLLVAILAIAVFAFAQGGATGAITGTVQDPTGSAVADATITVISDATNQSVRKVTTDTLGAFTATLLPVGSYSVEVSAPGFATTKFTSIVNGGGAVGSSAGSGSAPITAVIGTSRLIQFSLKYSF
jgi:hypothetical protein